MLCRFNFDWDASEDTHEEKLHDGAILFGRGKLAGIDMRAQCEAAAQKEKLLLSDMRRARGDMTTEADRKADNARAARAAAIDEDPVYSSICLSALLACQLCCSRCNKSLPLLVHAVLACSPH